MLVYRIEDQEGCGPFGDLSYDHDAYADKSCYRLPGPLDDDIEGHHAGHFYGCQSLGQLRNWFSSPDGCAAMARKGGTLVTYDCPDEHVLVGGHQVAFLKCYATEVSRVSARLLHG